MPKPIDTDWPDDVADDVRVLSDEEADKIKHDRAPAPHSTDKDSLKRQIEKDKKEKKRRW